MAGPLSLPFAGSAATYPITQPFGPTSLGIEPSVDQRSGSGYTHFHYGTDFGCPGSTPVIAAMDGTVLYSGLDPNGASYNGGYGNMILIQHQDNPALCTLYGHLRDIGSNITKGATVTRGMGIGDSGGVPGEFGAGNTTGHHLHFGVQVDRVYMNPVDYLNGQTATMTSPPQFTSKVSYGQTIYWARQAGVPESQLATAAAIAMAESGLDTHSLNISPGNHGVGLWQVDLTQHPQYSESWLQNGANNAAAMVAISSGGSNWMPWTTYHYTSVTESGVTRLVPVTPGSPQALYYQFLGAAQAALAETAPPAGSVVAGGGPGLSSAAAAAGAPPSAPLPPPLPVQTVSVQPVRVNPAALVTHPGARAAALLSIAARYVPVSSLDVTLPTFRQAGSFSATIPLAWLRLPQNAALTDVLLQKGTQQVTVYAGYIPEPARGFAPERLSPLFTGLLEGLSFDYDGPRENLTLSGPDLSGIFSAPGATPGNLEGSLNRRADQIVRDMVLAHNPRGQKGLDVVAETATTTAGQAYGGDLTQVRTGQNTEWDVMTTLAQNEGFALYMLGSTVYFQRLPGTDAAPVALAYGPDSAGRNDHVAGACTRVQITPQPHAKRDYKVACSSYQTRSATTLTKSAGNPDSPAVVGIQMPPNTPAVALQKRANSLWAEYSATEYLVRAEIAGVIPLAVGQPITFTGSRIAPSFSSPRHFFPTVAEYTYTTGRGLSMVITATNRPPTIASAQSTQDLTLVLS